MKKIQAFLLILKILIYLSDEIFPKKLNKKTVLPVPILFRFLTFLGAFCHWVIFTYFKSAQNSQFFFYKIWPISRKKFHLIEGPFIKFLDTEPQIRKKPLEIKKNTFSKIVLWISSQSKNTWGIAIFKHHFTLVYNFKFLKGSVRRDILRGLEYIHSIQTLCIEMGPWRWTFFLISK